MADVTYNPHFEDFFSDESFYKILYGSAGSGKSYAIAQKLVLRCLNEQGHTCWAFRKVSTYVEQSVFATILKVVDDCDAKSLVHVNKTQKTIHFKNNGNKIICAGLDDEEKIKSILSVTIAWVEEATEFNEQDINQLDLRMRGESSVYRELILSFNPVSELHWIKRKFFDDVTPGIAAKLYTNHSTFRENFFLDRDYKERLIQNHSHDPNNYRVYVLGEWGKVVTGQEYYKNFHEDTHVKACEYDDSLPIHLTFDFNTAPYMSASVWQIAKVEDKYEVRGLDELVMKHPKNSTEDTCYEFLDRWGDKCSQGLLIYGDATGRARKTSSKKTDYMIIEQILGHLIVEMRVPRSNPLPQDKHTFMNRMMFGTFPIQMYVHPDMKFTLQDLTHVLEDQDRKKVKARARDPVSKQIVEKFGHFSDGMDYFFMEAFKDFLV